MYLRELQRRDLDSRHDQSAPGQEPSIHFRSWRSASPNEPSSKSKALAPISNLPLATINHFTNPHSLSCPAMFRPFLIWQNQCKVLHKDFKGLGRLFSSSKFHTHLVKLATSLCENSRLKTPDARWYHKRGFGGFQVPGLCQPALCAHFPWNRSGCRSTFRKATRNHKNYDEIQRTLRKLQKGDFQWLQCKSRTQFPWPSIDHYVHVRRGLPWNE